jgi:hypothetical protein
MASLFPAIQAVPQRKLAAEKIGIETAKGTKVFGFFF